MTTDAITAEGLAQADATLLAGGLLYLDMTRSAIDAIADAVASVKAAKEVKYNSPKEGAVAVKAAQAKVFDTAAQLQPVIDKAGEIGARMRMRLLDDISVAGHESFTRISNELSRAWGDAQYARAGLDRWL